MYQLDKKWGERDSEAERQIEREGNRVKLTVFQWRGVGSGNWGKGGENAERSFCGVPAGWPKVEIHCTVSIGHYICLPPNA